MGDELGDGRLALGQPADDAQPVHVGHDLVEGTQLAQVFGLGDGGGDRAADPGGRGGQGWDSGWGLVRRGHINHGLYQSPLMLAPRRRLSTRAVLPTDASCSSAGIAGMSQPIARRIAASWCRRCPRQA